MDWLQFIAAVIGHLAWPIVILIVIFALRGHLGSLAERVLELSFGGAKITFDKYLAKGAELIAESPAPQSPEIGKPQLKVEAPKPPEPKQPANVPPFKESKVKGFVRRVLGGRREQSVVGLMQVLSSLDEVDRSLYDIGDLIGVDAADPLSVMYALAAREKISKSLLELYQTLRSAKQVIEHTHALPDEIEASEFVRQTRYLLAFLKMAEVELMIKAKPAG
jgi:hypothetical protein